MIAEFSALHKLLSVYAAWCPLVSALEICVYEERMANVGSKLKQDKSVFVQPATGVLGMRDLTPLFDF